MERELALAHPQDFDLLAVDAFSGDAPPIHLLTQQAFQIYLGELAPDGIIAVHVTNTYVDLRPVVTGIAEAMHLNSIFLHSEGDGRVTLYNDWVLVSRARWPIFDKTETTEPTHRRKTLLWTDDYSNLLEALR